MLVTAQVATDFQRIGASGFVLGRIRTAEAPRAPGPRLRYAAVMDGMREAIDQRIRAVLPGDKGATASALITGKRDAISTQVNEAMYVSAYRPCPRAFDLGLSHGGGGWRHVLCVPCTVCADAGLQQPPPHQELGDPRSVLSWRVPPNPELSAQIRGEGDFHLIPSRPVLPSWVAKG